MLRPTRPPGPHLSGQVPGFGAEIFWGAAGVAVKGEGCRAAGGRGEPVLRTARIQEVAFLETMALAVLVNAIDQLTADQVDTNYGRF